MVNTDLIRDLGKPDRHEAAADALVTLGAGGVEELVREVMDAESPVDWRPITAVLRRIGEMGFDGLLQGLLSASTEESRKRVGFAFSQLGVAVLDRYTAALTHPVPLVRRQAVRGIEHCGEAGRSAAVLLPLLGDPDQEVARQAQDTLTRTGEHVIPLLRRVRERGPGRQRARALTVLAELGGEPALSRADTAAVERLIRIKLPDDRPEPLWACWNYWMAVPGGDQAGIMRTLGLTDPRPVTFALGNDIVDADGHGCDTNEHTGYERVFVTPELDGWTLVLGAWCDPHGQERREDVLRLCTELSARYGRAQKNVHGSHRAVPRGTSARSELTGRRQDKQAEAHRRGKSSAAVKDCLGESGSGAGLQDPSDKGHYEREQRCDE
ncbi:HEAT repeat domain-containing protein [Streptomyces sp. NBC_00365]|uniref:HEAT repeat domain-containing protein n=1 Tax=Streptomyces sp. NBC_00365 TaxID=2975726 RepID=UPI0022521C15|nr:HEAT repeat domain-containing protein [Streptomyces sp. NBC_00365]MCX5091718.1 HEAT repeat domain-containing protein [Streptomyces sp. NBC_00365]